jgi:hypothetical protein
MMIASCGIGMNPEHRIILKHPKLWGIAELVVCIAWTLIGIGFIVWMFLPNYH